MARDADIIRTADICDEFGDELLVCELALNDYAGRNHFHGEVRTFATYEDNKGVRELLAGGGAGKVLVVDGADHGAARSSAVTSRRKRCSTGGKG